MCYIFGKCNSHLIKLCDRTNWLGGRGQLLGHVAPHAGVNWNPRSPDGSICCWNRPEVCYIFVTLFSCATDACNFEHVSTTPTIDATFYLGTQKEGKTFPRGTCFMTNGVVQSQTWQAKENVTPAGKVCWCRFMWFRLFFWKPSNWCLCARFSDPPLGMLHFSALVGWMRCSGTQPYLIETVLRYVTFSCCILL